MIRLFFFLGCLLLTPLAAEYEKSEFVISPDGRTGTIHFYRFADRDTALQIVSRGTHKNLEAAMQANHCLAGCNGGFFHPDMQPLGEVIASGKKLGRKNLESSLTSGVIYQQGERIIIERSQAFYNKKQALPEQLLQTGPFLIEKKKIVKGLSDRKFARRTIIATDGNGKWLIAYTPPTTLAQLAQSLSQAGDQFGFTIETALNLDGGASSALWIDRGVKNHPFYLREIKGVANYLGFVRK